ncbi:DUF1700 domain-containing protein [Blautia sp. CLA-JM-H16]|uniref:DUF1700 domain-containing protein n=1 Tax=Blautia aquisgranensis TaxID=3133153 RepID=A0ABV1BCG8_9FIRM
MTRNEYMEQLKRYLRRLPKEDYENAVEYFSEYFDEAGPENEQQMMKDLGDPKEAAREVLLNLLEESVENGSAEEASRTETVKTFSEKALPEKKKRSPGKIILLAFLVICASPVSIALLIAGLAVLAAVVLVIAAVIFSLAVTSIATIAGGIMVVGFGATLVMRSLAAACMMVGGGFLLAGAGILFGVLTVYICKWCATGIGRLVNRMVRKKVSRHE